MTRHISCQQIASFFNVCPGCSDAVCTLGDVGADVIVTAKSRDAVLAHVDFHESYGVPIESLSVTLREAL